jgi:hypothetical protein
MYIKVKFASELKNLILKCKDDSKNHQFLALPKSQTTFMALVSS